MEITFSTRLERIIFCLEIILFLNILNFAGGVQNGSQCGGYCTDDLQKCKNRGGRIMGFCTNSLACCDPLIHAAAKCGDIKSGQKIVDFKSPDYPSFLKGDLTCLVKIDLLNDNIATRIDFIQADMEGPAFSETENDSGACEADMIFLRGFESWAPPPRCGNLSGYSFVIDRDTPQGKSMSSLSILALMASSAYRWHIRVIQLLKSKTSFDNQNSVYDSDTPIFNKGKRSLLNPIQPKLDDLDEEESGVSESVIVTGGNNNYTDDDISNDGEKRKSKSVLNGEDTKISTVPWQVSFRYKSESLNPEELSESQNQGCSETEGIHFCGGSIIGDQFILTASHCFYGISKTSGMVHLPFVKAVVGDTNLCKDDSENNTIISYDHDIESVTMHYAYDSNLLINDIAIVKLKTSIQFKDHVKPIMLASSEDDYSDMEAMLSGWGDYLKLKIDDKEEESENGPSFLSNDTYHQTSTTTETQIKITTPTITTPESITPTMETDLEYENITFASTEEVTPTTPKSMPVNQDLKKVFELETPHILQSSRRFLIQNKTVCNIKDLEQYSSTKDNMLQYMKYASVFDSTLCTLSILSADDPNPVSTGKGDSGGPLVVYYDKKAPVLVGVVSYGISENEADICNPADKSNKTFDYFSSVGFFRGWIDLVVLSYQNYSHVA